MSKPPILNNLTIAPKAAKHELYRWCDYIELRCLVHPDSRFSRDGLIEAISESTDVSWGDDELRSPEDLEPVNDDIEPETVESDDRTETFAARCFRHLRWRAHSFGDRWPFVLDDETKEIRLRLELTRAHYFYLQLLLSSSLKYCHKQRCSELTGQFERLSLSVFKQLMPLGAEVHAFGAAQTSRYSGHLYDRLLKLATDVRGQLRMERRDFAPQNAGDGGLDLVAWHDLGDTRDGIPIAFAQCGCTATGWPDKMLAASPARMSKKLVVAHNWATYYFMPLDLSNESSDQMQWQKKWDLAEAIVIDRLRLIRLSDPENLHAAGLLTVDSVNEAMQLRIA